MTQPLFSETDYLKRRQGVIHMAAARHGVRVLIVTDPTDIRYLTGCTEGGTALLCGREWARLYTNKMFIDCVRTQAPGVDVTIPHAPVFEQARHAMNRMKHRAAVGFQGNHMSCQTYQRFADAMGRWRTVDIGTLVTACRAVKNEQELRLARKCVRIAEKAMRSMLEEGLHAFLGRTEKRLAAELEYRMRRLGADRQAFPDGGIIVAAGTHSARCHHVPTERRVRRGDPLLFDWGAELHGYRSDITRVLFIGSPRPKLAGIYELVRRANREGVAAIRPGVATHTVARRAWDVVRDGGYSDNIRHGLGHGLGLDIHELPRVGTGTPAPTGAMRLRTNMLLTVEPGIYIKGIGGIRIEDDIRVAPQGYECLTRFPRRIEDVTLR